MIIGSAGYVPRGGSVHGESDSVLTGIDNNMFGSDDEGENESRQRRSQVESIDEGSVLNESKELKEGMTPEIVASSIHQQNVDMADVNPVDVDDSYYKDVSISSSSNLCDLKLNMESFSVASMQSDSTSQFQLMDFTRGVIQSINDSLPSIVYKKWFPVNSGHEIDPSQALATASFDDRMKLYTITTLCHGESSNKPLLVLRRVSENKQEILEDEVDVERAKREYQNLDIVWVSSIVQDLEELVYKPLRSICKQSLVMTI